MTRTQLACALLVALSCVACSGGTRTATGTTAATMPVQTVGTFAVVPPSTNPPGVTTVKVYWTRDCPPPEKATDIGTCKLSLGELRPTLDPDVPRAALEALMVGPNPTEKALGLASNVRGITHLNALTIEGDTAVVDFNRYFQTALTRPQVAQVVYTLTQFPEIRAVRFLVDGITNGATGVPAQTRGDLVELLPPVFVDAPAISAPVGALFRVGGSAISPNGTIAARVEGPSGERLGAGEGGVVAKPGERGPFGLTVQLTPAASGPAVLVVSSPTDESRLPINLTAA